MYITNYIAVLYWETERCPCYRDFSKLKDLMEPFHYIRYIFVGIYVYTVFSIICIYMYTYASDVCL